MRNFDMTTLLGIEFALFVIFSSSNFMLFTWESVAAYLLVIVITSFLGGTILVDYARSLKMVSAAYIASCIGFVVLNILPLILQGEAMETINLEVAAAASSMAKWAVISFPIGIFLCLLGCFLGSDLLESSRRT